MSTTTLYVLGGLALVGVLAVWRSGRKSAIKAQRGVREVTRMTANALRTLLTAAVIAGTQWAVIHWVDNPAVTAVALAVPALLAGAAVARLLAVTEVVSSVRGHH
ncbi:hypothetical protein [Amycolatopsis sp. CA-230715]|uniref:hypothetical protein n=1 Tax=Amycolatopsis sp. CA-230715 TaxID=2745196 RepID=UPI001C020796|nr:hypothetical protein [Amycolatopsis sp. CA-230715]QWF80454.1 hypothetical protein HUW46_03876 [Amycolatopsis sp. CA-230715]